MKRNFEEFCLLGIGFALRERLCVEEAELSPLCISLTWVKEQCTFASDIVWGGHDAWSLEVVWAADDPGLNFGYLSYSLFAVNDLPHSTDPD